MDQNKKKIKKKKLMDQYEIRLKVKGPKYIMCFVSHILFLNILSNLLSSMFVTTVTRSAL